MPPDHESSAGTPCTMLAGLSCKFLLYPAGGFIASCNACLTHMFSTLIRHTPWVYGVRNKSTRVDGRTAQVCDHCHDDLTTFFCRDTR